MKVYVCDRCGSEYSKNKMIDPKQKAIYKHGRIPNIVAVATVSTTQNIYKRDLCDKCLKEFVAWVDNPKMTVVDTEQCCCDDTNIVDDKATKEAES